MKKIQDLSEHSTIIKSDLAIHVEYSASQALSLRTSRMNHKAGG